VKHLVKYSARGSAPRLHKSLVGTPKSEKTCRRIGNCSALHPPNLHAKFLGFCSTTRLMEHLRYCCDAKAAITGHPAEISPVVGSIDQRDTKVNHSPTGPEATF